MTRKALIVGLLIGLYLAYLVKMESTGSTITFPPEEA